MGASTLYSSTDTSAPVLVDGVGSLVNILKKCLVAGYGTKPGLGWTQEFISPDGNVVVFRNKGTGLFLKVSNAMNYAATGMAAQIEVFEAMRAWDIGYLRTPETGVNQYFAYANTKTGARVCKWKVIGDDKGFWIITEFSTTALSYAAAYFGDYSAYHMENKFNWISFTHTGVEVTGDHYWCSFNKSNTHIRIPRTSDNKLPPSSPMLLSGSGRDNTSSVVAYTKIGRYSYDSYGEITYISSPFPVFATPHIAEYPSVAPWKMNLLGTIPGFLGCLSYTPSGTVVAQSTSISVHVFWLVGEAKIGIIVGEGFRP